ncbi:phage gp6-like head-tail connector family protein [Blastomonas sp. RAC04]|uniref:head-tail connector protein n=1 Tax=Blastomonas sp. RAC04 TaxID=1842535 RepID=UPI00083E6088|nr:head-tail connector protein [Blastomonas sp. RAC04]AOG00391.1 phage gp6-like head-tail connector family protein [Blastomonas sp. RAC04]
MILTLAEAKAHLRVDNDDEDSLIELMLESATDSVTDIATAWDGEGDAPARLKLAVLTRVAVMFDNRHSAEAGHGEDRLILPLRELDV